jgi:hypothetical protein
MYLKIITSKPNGMGTSEILGRKKKLCFGTSESAAYPEHAINRAIYSRAVF